MSTRAPSTGRRFAPPTLLALLAVGGCTVGPDFRTPAPPPAAGYAAPADASVPAPAAPAAVAGADTPLRWWEAFGNRDLDALVDRAIAGNASLAAADATLARARQQVAAVAGRRYPQVDLSTRVERQEANLAAFGLDLGAVPGFGGNPVFDLYTVGGGIGFDPDLFGANRRRLEQAAAQADARRRQAEAAHLSIAGRVVNQVLAIASIRARLAAVDALLADDARVAALAETRRLGGEGTLVEVLNAQSQLAGDRGERPPLVQSLDEARHMLATLLGIAPDALGPTDFDLAGFALPRAIPVALPSALVARRPDILQAEADLHAATAAVGVATAALYPDITLGATGTTAAPRLGDLFGGQYRAFDLFAGLGAPIFRGGTLKAQRRAATAEAQASAAQYRQTVLEAFQQVADLLAALGNDQRTVEGERAAAAIATRSRDLSRRSFEAGNTGILTTLDAERLHQRAQLALVDARARQLIDVARLFVATAGGWTGPAVATATR